MPRARLFSAALGLPLAGLGSLLAWLSDPPALPPDHQGLCRMEAAGGVDFIVCDVPLDHYDLRLATADEDGVPYETFAKVAASFSSPMVLAVNAGMFDEARRPVGLAVEDGVERHPVSTADGPGNFSMKPNGIFYVENGRAGVMETGRFLAEGHRPSLATQSGPMLLIDGALHPRFIEGSDSRFVRNGICATDEGRLVHFVMTRQKINFWDFALFFRDRLGCRDALFLDGKVSSLFYPAGGIDYRPDRLGPMLSALAKPGVSASEEP
ncbi:phosphodiester glycosidase family protein [Consotaella salsifontis]|uniref:Uncharacterized protein YigE, DUF2233 family n=1 Tax=Consotaella salsifontis TaxID=1365950 RepID=A0A1T4QJX5_9HYPH|nr:phosphodiester glycosidase family protein [Consotaella salsifontis]SKA03937.1 Uncharacterized protein YigE, DUF2233 family [Consotaella salsifontis]